MRLDQLSFSMLLPSFLRDSKTALGLSAAADNILNTLIEKADDTLIIPSIDNLPENLLDELATSLHVFWYDKGTGIETKRNLIHSVYKVYQTLGTLYAVERVLLDYLGNAIVFEWFSYQGAPFCFKIETKTDFKSENNYASLIRAIYAVKNVRSHLEQLKVVTSQSHSLFLGLLVSRNRKAEFHLQQSIGDSKKRIFVTLLSLRRRKSVLTITYPEAHIQLPFYYGFVLVRKRKITLMSIIESS